MHMMESTTSKVINKDDVRHKTNDRETACNRKPSSGTPRGCYSYVGAPDDSV